jgi:hypothetical protein
MAERVVYFLGAGFSAPLGLPTTADFLLRSKDLFAQKPDELEFFARVYEAIARMQVVKSYYTADLFNIEEILSILEMDHGLGETDTKDLFTGLIASVIKHTTPSIPLYPTRLPGNWEDVVFGYEKGGWQRYGWFALSLANAVGRTGDSKLHLGRSTDPAVRYDVVTVNYDRVIEEPFDFVRTHYSASPDLRTQRPGAGVLAEEGPRIAKLHGSVDAPPIVPPTWNKTLNPRVLAEWQLASTMLAEANYIRIIGYSLPATDTYVRYLLKSAAMRSPHLKRIDVLCLDPSGEVRARYDEFIAFRYYNFRSGDVASYLSECEPRRGVGADASVYFDRLEFAHGRAFPG